MLAVSAGSEATSDRDSTLGAMSESNRHALWRVVGNNFKAFDDDAPEGYAAICEVHIAGRPEPIKLSQVHTRKDTDFQWHLLVPQREGPSDPEKPAPDDRAIFVHESTILRVEIYYVPTETVTGTKQPIGFTYSTDLQVDD